MYFFTINQNFIALFFTDYAQLFASLIGRTAKDIDTLIESLPNEESSTELQVWMNRVYYSSSSGMYGLKPTHTPGSYVGLFPWFIFGL